MLHLVLLERVQRFRKFETWEARFRPILRRLLQSLSVDTSTCRPGRKISIALSVPQTNLLRRLCVAVTCRSRRKHCHHYIGCIIGLQRLAFMLRPLLDNNKLSWCWQTRATSLYWVWFPI